MSLIKRISTTLTASVDNLVDQVENHDAVIEASIKKARQAAADTRVRLGRLQKDGKQLEARIEKLRMDSEKWHERAVGAAKEDQDKALQCLQRKKQNQGELDLLQKNLVAHRSTERHVADNLKKVESRVSELSLQRNSFRSRESAARANHIIQRLEGDHSSGIEETFDRWESRLLAQETEYPLMEVEDLLDNEYIEAEQRLELELELEELVGSHKGMNND